MREIGDFTVEVYSTSDIKKLKKGTKTYRYGTISIRDSILTEYVGKKVRVKVFEESEKRERGA